MAYRLLSFFAAATLLLAGCDNPKEPGKASFRATLQAWFDANPECVNIGRIPAVLRTDAPPNKRAPYEALVAKGLLSVEKDHEEGPSIMGQSRSYDAFTYRPTDTGTKVIRKSTDPLFGGFDLCFARRNVVQVTSYTEPADVMGLRASQVQYRYRMEDIRLSIR